MSTHANDLFKFARLTPVNLDAINCFTQTFVHMVSRNDHYHLQFCVADVDQARRIGEAQEQMVSGSPEARQSPDPVAFQMLDGFYQLSLEDTKLPHLSKGWRVGRGTFKVPNRGVEMMMVRSDDLDAVSILHCRFRLHPKTGVLLIRNMTKDRNVSYQYRGEARNLAFGEERPLCQRETRIHIGSMQFILEYTIPGDEERQGDFLRLLHGALISGQDDEQDPPMSFGYLPADLSSSLQKEYLLSTHTRGFGAFGWFCAAIDTKTGDATAIKALEIRRNAQHQEVLREAQMWRRVNGTFGLLPLYAEWCEHGKSIEHCNKITEKVYFASQLGRFDFLHRNWRDIPWRNQLTMLRQTLEGLNGLHQLGIMHRDVSCKNMLVMSLNPPSAVVHDFGKAIQALYAQEKGLGPLPYVAPEVDGSPYTNLVDAWSWAFSVIVAFGYSRDATEKVTPHRIALLHLALDKMRERHPELRRLTKLLRGMIEWNPDLRTSVKAALEDPCWQDCSDRYCDMGLGLGLVFEEEIFLKKVKRTDTDSTIGSGRLIAVATPTDTTSSHVVLPETVPTQLIGTAHEATGSSA